jgi:hypothetical protein
VDEKMKEIYLQSNHIVTVMETIDPTKFEEK